jgi:lysophospholipase L1-like esterase
LVVPRDALLFSWEKSDAVLEAHAGTSPRDVRLLPKPNSSRSDQDGPHVWHTRINAQGFRGSTPTRPSAPDRYRVLAVGDSWVYGISTSQGHTFAERLEAELGDVDGRKAEVINAGVPSFSAFDMLVRYHDAMAWLKVDALLVGAPHNEGIQSARAALRKRWYAGIEAGPQSDLYLFLGLRRMLAWLRTPRYAPGLDATAATAAMADLRALTEDGKKRGLAVVFVAWGNRWENGSVSRGDLRRWAGLDATLAAVGLSQRSCFGFSDEAHPSEAGAQAAAVHVASVLRSGLSDGAWVDQPNCDENDAIGPGKQRSGP